jgi:tetratricopeptide (TPR) repeat protein
LKALEMDDTLAEAHTSLAYTRWLGDLDWSGAEREFKRAIELNSNYVMAREWYAEYLAALGRHEEALAEIQKAQQLDPLSVPVNRAAGWVLFFGRHYDEAIEELRKALVMDPDFLGLAWCSGGPMSRREHTSRRSPISGGKPSAPGSGL